MILILGPFNFGPPLQSYSCFVFGPPQLMERITGPLFFVHPHTKINGVRYTLKSVCRFIFHAGDISYARGWGYIWEQWGAMIEPYATLAPYMVGIGNHEYDHTAGGIGRDPSGIATAGGWKPSWFNGGQDSGGECGVPMFKR